MLIFIAVMGVIVLITLTDFNKVGLNSKDKLIFIRNNEMPIDTRVGAGKIIVKDKLKKIYQFAESK